MKSSALSRSLDLTPQGRLDEGGLHDLLGYQLAQATIVTDADFKHHCGEPFDLRQVEFTILQLIRENAGVTSTRLAQALAVVGPEYCGYIGSSKNPGRAAAQSGACAGAAQDTFGVADGGVS